MTLSAEDDLVFKVCAFAKPSWQTASELSAALGTAAVSMGSRAGYKSCEELVWFVLFRLYLKDGFI